ncbi:MAG: hypothetical protein ACE5IW_08785 [bacterium]
MKSFIRITLILGLMLFIIHFGCSDNPSSSTPTAGTVKISIKRASSATPMSSKKVVRNTTTSVTITSAHVVIKEIEFESVMGDTLDFEFEQPFIQDLMVGSNLHEIETIEVPFGSYKKSEIKIDDLNPNDGAVYTQNPDLQNRSILVRGFLNNDQNETFVFTSDLDKDQEREFEPPLVLDANSPSTNIVLTLNMDTWFVDHNGDPLDPRDPSNKSIIENNIKDSIVVFEDKDDDGERDD